MSTPVIDNIYILANRLNRKMTNAPSLKLEFGEKRLAPVFETTLTKKLRFFKKMNAIQREFAKIRLKSQIAEIRENDQV